MGQAKLRGDFNTRLQQAIERKVEQAERDRVQRYLAELCRIRKLRMMTPEERELHHERLAMRAKKAAKQRGLLASLLSIGYMGTNRGGR